MADIAAGARLAERYVIVEPLGAGGMGVVHRAHDERLGRMVALKTLSARAIGDAGARARLIREARAVAALEHPSIVQVFDVGETGEGGAFLVMELVRGQSLRGVLRDGGPLPPLRAAEIVSALAGALGSAHRAGVIHRDVKPDNVMIRDDGRVVLLDFGLVKDVARVEEGAASITADGSIVGTPTYLAPEQAHGRASAASDQFALAVTAFELLTGRPPWIGESPTHLLAQILIDPPPRASREREGLPPEVDDVLARGLSKDEADRFASIEAFAGALGEALGAAPPQDLERPARGSVAVATTLAAPSGNAAPSVSAAPRRLAPLIGVAIAVAAAVAVVWASAPPEEAAAPLASAPPVAPLAPDAIVACPVLEARGVPEPTSWLGAAAADLACRWLSMHLGGVDARTRIPAELLELPRVPAGDDFPAAVYDAPDVRARTLSAARAHHAWIDGEIRREGGGTFSARLALVTEGGTLAERSGTGATMHAAVQTALFAAAEAGGLAQQPIDPEVTRWFGARSTDELIEVSARTMTISTGVGLRDACEATARDGQDALPVLRAAMASRCESLGVRAARRS